MPNDMIEEQVWISACKYIEIEIKDVETFKRWISTITPISFKNGILLLGVSDDFTSDWLRVHFNDIIANAFKSVVNKNVKVKYETGHVKEIPAHEVKPERKALPAKSHLPVKDENHSAPNCNPKFTFGTFVVGPENSLAYEAAMSILQTESSLSVNPLFIYSSPGLGKTHLIQAIANEAMRKNKKHVVEYLRCEDFLNLYTDSIRSKDHHNFRDRFRKVDYLLIDDIQFLSGKTNLQEEFFNTFNKLHNEDKKILLTSDKTPSEINRMEHRLISRFVSGLIVEITPFSEETKFAILKKKKQESHLIKFDDKVLWFIAQNTRPDVRKLEGALMRLILYSSVKKIEMHLEVAQEVLKDYLAEMAAVRLTVETIQKKVAEYFDLRVSDLTGSKRPANVAMPRMIAMYLCRKMTDKSLFEIGEAFGRNHATVIHAFNRIQDEYSANEQMKRKISQLESKLQVA